MDFEEGNIKYAMATAHIPVSTCILSRELDFTMFCQPPQLQAAGKGLIIGHGCCAKTQSPDQIGELHTSSQKTGPLCDGYKNGSVHGVSNTRNSPKCFRVQCTFLKKDKNFQHFIPLFNFGMNSLSDVYCLVQIPWAIFVEGYLSHSLFQIEGQVKKKVSYCRDFRPEETYNPN